MGILKENKPAIRFLLVFVGLYLLSNTFYGLFIEYYSPHPDPVTRIVTQQTTYCLSLFDSSVAYESINASPNIAIKNNRGRVLLVYEGCNGVNVMIVFLCFLMAFRGSWKQSLIFGIIGLLIIHLMNLGRVSLLYGISIYFPQYLYFFHKYLLTGALYVVVFYLWYRWVNLVRHVGA